MLNFKVLNFLLVVRFPDVDNESRKPYWSLRFNSFPFDRGDFNIFDGDI